MSAPEELADQVARLAESMGWTLVEHRAASNRVALMFEVNESLYGEQSSVHRAKARVAVLTDVLTQKVLRDMHP